MELENKINWEIHKSLDTKQDTSQYLTIKDKITRNTEYILSQMKTYQNTQDN